MLHVSWKPGIQIGLAGTALAAGLRIASLGVRPVWLDEALTLHALSLDWTALVTERISAGHSPVYFLAMKAIGLDGGNLLHVRLASAMMDSLACGLLAAAVVRVAGARAGAIAAVFYALNPLVMYWGQNARPYGMLMMWIALAIHGASGLISRAAQGPLSRADAMTLSMGLAGAAATLTAGTIAAALVAVSPFATHALRADRAFRVLWARALILPGLVAIAMVALVSLPHAEAMQGVYWTGRYAPASLRSAGIILLETVAGDRYAQIAPAFASQGGIVVLALSVLALLLSCAAQPLRTLPQRSGLLPLVVLAVAYPAILLGVSLSTSLMVARYFLPAVAALLMLAAIGAAGLSRTRTGSALLCITISGLAVLALNQSLNSGWPRDPVARQMSGLILALPHPGTRVFVDPSDDVGMALQTDLLIERPHATTFPTIEIAVPDRVKAAIAGGAPVFLGIETRFWNQGFAAALPVPVCQWTVGGAVLAYWAPRPAACLVSE